MGLKWLRLFFDRLPLPKPLLKLLVMVASETVAAESAVAVIIIKTYGFFFSIQGKIEAEFELVDGEEADEKPVGLARKEPEALDKPIRPDLAFMWLLMPLRIFYHVFFVRYILFLHGYMYIYMSFSFCSDFNVIFSSEFRFRKWILILLCIIIVGLFLGLCIYTTPGALTTAVFG